MTEEENIGSTPEGSTAPGEQNVKTHAASVLDRLNERDINVLNIMVEFGPMRSRARQKWFAGENRRIQIKLKAFLLIKPVHRKKDWDLDVTNFGRDVLNEWRRQQQGKKEE